MAPMIGVRSSPVFVMQLWDRNFAKYSMPSVCACLRSTPAQNAGSVPVSTMTRTVASASASSRAL